MAKTLVYALLLCILVYRYPKSSKCLNPYPDHVTNMSRALIYNDDPKLRLMETLHKALTNATNTAIFIKQLESQTKEPIFRQVLDDCFQEYDALRTHFLPEAIELAKKGDDDSYRKINRITLGCVNYARGCEGSFRPRPSPLTRRNRLMQELCRTAADVAASIVSPIPPAPAP